MPNQNEFQDQLKINLRHIKGYDEQESVLGNILGVSLIVLMVVGMLCGLWALLTYTPETRITSNQQNGFMLGCITHSEYAVCENRWEEYSRRLD